jgi:hypothetical protein
MLTIFRRHFKSCKFSAKGRRHRHCNCPLTVEGESHGAFVRQSLDLRNWEAAQKLVRDWEISDRGLCRCRGRKLSREEKIFPIEDNQDGY